MAVSSKSSRAAQQAATFPGNYALVTRVSRGIYYGILCVPNWEAYLGGQDQHGLLRSARRMGKNVVFLARRLSKGLTGHVTLTELRVYGPRGSLRCYSARENKHWSDTVTPVADGEYLYLIDGHKIVALQLQPEE